MIEWMLRDGCACVYVYAINELKLLRSSAHFGATIKNANERERKSIGQPKWQQFTTKKNKSQKNDTQDSGEK